MPGYKAALLVVSDSVVNRQSEDLTTSAVIGTLNASGDYQIVHKSVVADDKESIIAKLGSWIGTVSLILTAGGTGFSSRDVTPEAVATLIEKPAPGLVYEMLNKSCSITPYGVLSRPVAGIAQSTLIVTLPGSPKAAAENLQAIIDILPHGLDQLTLDSSRKLHQNHTHKCSHSSHHGHHLVSHALVSNDPYLPVTQRNRESPYAMISVSSALELISKYTPQPETETRRTDDALLCSSVVAEDVQSNVDVPSFRASIVDGYAVVSRDCPGELPVASVSHATASNTVGALVPGSVARITTGAPVPPGSDAVVMVEHTQIVSTTADGLEEKVVRVLAKDVASGDNIREIGSDLKRHDLVLEKHQVISPVGGEIGVVASVGVAEITVFRKPKIGVLSTGDELVDLKHHSKDTPMKYGQIFDSNRPSIIAALTARQFEVSDLGIASDQPQTLERVIVDLFLSTDLDYLITTGGVSMGELDLLKSIIERDLNGTVHFGRVAMKPGKPTTFASVNFHGRSKLIFGLPGNPASALVTLHLFVFPSLYQASGLRFKNHCFPQVIVKTQHSIKLDPRPEYHRVKIYQDPKSGQLTCSTTGFQRSSRVASMKTANGLLCLPSSKDRESDVIEPGSSIKALLIDSLDTI